MFFRAPFSGIIFLTILCILSKMAPKMAPKMSGEIYAGRLFHAPRTNPCPQGSFLKLPWSFWLPFWLLLAPFGSSLARFGSILAPFAPNIHVFVMVFAHFSNILHRHCRQFLPASCCRVFRFHCQHLKVSAVALRLQ